MSRDMIKLQLSQHFCRVTKFILSRDTSLMSRGSDIMLRLSCIQKLQYMHFQFDYMCSVTTYNILFAAVVRYKIKHLFYQTSWSLLFWSHKKEVTSLIRVHREYLPAALILHTKLDLACDVIFIASEHNKGECFTK